LQILEESKQDVLVTLLTRDKSSFVLEYAEFEIWATSRDEFPEKVKTTTIEKGSHFTHLGSRCKYSFVSLKLPTMTFTTSARFEVEHLFRNAA